MAEVDYGVHLGLEDLVFPPNPDPSPVMLGARRRRASLYERPRWT